MNVIRIILSVILAIDCLGTDRAGAHAAERGGDRSFPSSIAGGAETFFGKKKAASYEGKLELLTRNLPARVFMVLCLVCCSSCSALPAKNDQDALQSGGFSPPLCFLFGKMVFPPAAVLYLGQNKWESR